MPKYHFECRVCGKALVRILTPAQAKDPLICSEDGGAFKRTPRPPSASVKERLDNGLMAKAIERPAEAERLYHERAQKDPDKP